MVGIFLHSCNAPQTVVELLSRMSLSISSTSISRAVQNLSKEAERAIRLAGQSLLAAYAYDNLDVDLKHSVPTIEKARDTLVHFTTGTMLPLSHITLDNLNCSDELWRNYYRNPDIEPKDLPKVAIDQLHSIHPEEPHVSKLSRRNRYNAWKYRSDLVNFGPEFFHRFRRKLGDPEEVEQIPLSSKPSEQVPLRAVDISPSTPDGNVEALDNFFTQAGVGDPADDSRAKAIGNHAVLVFGDLLTGQHIRSVLESRSVEGTPWRRFQFIVYVMGLFHLKMACADALWRIFIHPKKSDIDSNSLMGLVSQIRPKETGRIKSKPGFRRMHEIIQHVGIVSRLDMWRIAVSRRNSAHTTLEDFAKSEPSWELIENISLEIVREEAKTADISRLRLKPDAERDQQRENTLLLRRYFLLYEEISHAMNHGDIGRVEACFLPWMHIFLGCGKHKYAVEMRRYLENVHFLYPKGLR